MAIRRKKIGRVIKRMVIFVTTIAVLFIVFLLAMGVMEYCPEPEEVLFEDEEAPVFSSDTIRLLSWNIGYAGLGDDMDFFYDGGRSMRTTKRRTIENLDSIAAFLGRHKEIDFILLQEVDINSRRSYYINEFDSLKKVLPGYHAFFAYNYKVPFVPIPLRAPMGKVQSGLAFFSRYVPQQVVRYQYPGSFPFPVRLFNLKRALLSVSFKMADGTTLYINNPHNSAYDDGSMRQNELDFLNAFLQEKKYAVTAGDWNSVPPSYIPGEKEMKDSYFVPLRIAEDTFDSTFVFAADTEKKSTRYGYEPFDNRTTTQTLLDFALLSSGIKLVSTRIIPLQYRNSDHNPAISVFVIDR